MWKRLSNLKYVYIKKQEIVLAYPKFQILAGFCDFIAFERKFNIWLTFSLKNSWSFFISELADQRMGWVALSVLLKHPGWWSCEIVAAVFRHGIKWDLTFP